MVLKVATNRLGIEFGDFSTPNKGERNLEEVKQCIAAKHLGF